MEPKIVRCKVKCNEVTKRADYQGGFVYVAKLNPVTSGSPENEQFYRYTPGGSFELQTLKDDHFEVGQEYFVDFTPAS